MNKNVFAPLGDYLMLALDHLGSFNALVAGSEGGQTSEARIISTKRRIIEPLVPYMTGVLLDSDHGLPAYRQAVPDGRVPFLLRVEESGYLEKGSERLTNIVYSAAELQKQGAAGVKLLLFMNPLVKSAATQVATAKQVVDDAAVVSLPLFLEIVTYDVPGLANDKGEMIIRAIEMLQEANAVPDVWKLEYPGSSQLCTHMHDVCAGVPWILLTRGVPFETFVGQLSGAVAAGCQGFLAGRALWQEVGKYQGDAQEDFLRNTLPARFKKLTSIVRKKS